VETSTRNYKFFPGCLARVKLPHIEKSVRVVLDALGIGLNDEPRFTCCPDPVVFRSASRHDWLRIAAHNLARNGCETILTLCPGCASSLAEAAMVLREEAEGREVLAELRQDNHEPGIPGVLHFLKVLTEEDVLSRLKGLVRRDLGSFKVAAHYGCHLLKPSVAVAFDDPEQPTSLERIIHAVGAQVVDYQDKLLCCGRPAIDEQTSQSIAEHKLNCLKEAGCDLLVVACPFCFEQFDLGQVVIGRKKGLTYGLPVLYVTQLVGLAMDMDKPALGLGFHRVRPDKILEL